MFYLSKSKYCNAVQCPKIVWMSRNMPEQFDESVMNAAVLSSGNDVGDLAMGYFGEYTEVPYDKHLSKMIEETERLIKEGVRNIAEASFSYEGQFCSVDILINHGDGRVEINEVKSSTGVREIYLYDAAFQYYVLTKLGYNVERVCILHINNQYVRHGDIDLQELFTCEDITKNAKEKYPETEQRIRELEEYMQQKTEPVMEIGEHCYTPYTCAYLKYCGRDLPHPNVFDLVDLGLHQKEKFYKQGIVTYEDLYSSGKLTKKVLQQVDHEIHDREDEIDVKGIREILDKLYYPLYFLDFEAGMTAVPQYDGTKPYQQIPFQYSLHYIEEEGGELQHREYLAEAGGDPRRGLAEQLCRDIPENACVTAYSMSYEKGRIREMAELYPDLKDHLMNIHDHIQDLLVPFQKRMYYNRAMHGKSSIKYVLPALYPDDPELNYHNLEGVQVGTDAAAAFLLMPEMSEEERQKTREQLLKYCGLDTLAMVKVWEKLKEAVRENSDE